MNFLIYICICIFYLNNYYLPLLANVTLPLCSNNNTCDNITSSEFYLQVNEFTTIENDETYEEYFDFDESSLPQPMHVTSNNSTAVKSKNLDVHKVKADICLCDLTVIFN